jgi:hypothetical protein
MVTATDCWSASVLGRSVAAGNVTDCAASATATAAARNVFFMAFLNELELMEP